MSKGKKHFLVANERKRGNTNGRMREANEHNFPYQQAIYTHSEKRKKSDDMHRERENQFALHDVIIFPSLRSHKIHEERERERATTIHKKN
jgi:hypothetical protein